MSYSCCDYCYARTRRHTTAMYVSYSCCIYIRQRLRLHELGVSTLHYYYICALIMSSYYCTHYTTLYVSSLYPHTAAICVLRVHELGRPPRPNLLYLCPSRARTRAAICFLRVHELGQPQRPNLNILCTVTKPHMRSPTALILLFTMPSAYRFGEACD